MIRRNPTQKDSRIKDSAVKELGPQDFPASKHPVLAPGLYLVSTPIGNLRDISLRALDTLAAADVVVCEDTRVTGKLLTAYGIKKRMISYNDHNAPRQRDPVLKIIEGGGAVAMTSDAGTPLLSDPGYKLVREAVEHGMMVTSIPGACAAITGLQLSSLPPDAFTFGGFLPPKSAGRRAALSIFKPFPATLVFYESGPRLLESLKDMRAVLGDRNGAIARELTKKHEEVRRGRLSALIPVIESDGPPKGEIVIILGPSDTEEVSEENIETQIRRALSTLSVRDAAEAVATATGKSRKTIYTLTLKLAGERTPGA